MSCDCGDPFCDGYNCNNNNGGGALVFVAIVILYPYIPFMIVGYELMDKLADGTNIFKWLGAIAGFVLGWFFYFRFFRKIVDEILNIQNTFLYWIICYILASFLFMLLEPIYPNNQVLVHVMSFWESFFRWCMNKS